MKNEKPTEILTLTIKGNVVPNHTFMTILGGYQILWITALTSVDPTLNEYRVSYTNGVVKYFVIDEFIGTPFECLIPQIKALTDKVDEADICVIAGEFYCRK